MNKKLKVAIIATAALLVIGAVAFAQSGGSSRQNGDQKAPFTLGGEQVNCGGGSGRAGGYGGYGGGGYDDGSGSGSGNGGGFSCH